MFERIAKFTAKFCIVGGLIAIVCYIVGATPETAAHMTLWGQMTWVVARLIPGRVWLAIGEGLADVMPWIFIGLLS
jgi:hypothetical protein